jgi:peptidoglycan-associated lipoprotein
MKKFLFLSILVSLFILKSTAQELTKPPSKYVVKANETLASGDYFYALSQCEKAYKKIGTKGSINEKGSIAFSIAEANRQLSRYEQANNWYGVCIELRYFERVPEVYFYKGNMLKMMGDFPKAQKAYESYKKIAPKSMSKQIEDAIFSLQKFKDFKTDDSRIVIKCETKVNTNKYDMAPCFADKKGKVIYFSSSRENSFGADRDLITGDKFMDIFMASFDDKGNLADLKTIDTEGIINTSQSEGSVCFDSKRKTMYFTRCPNPSKISLGCSIWTVDVLAEGFDNPNKMKFNIPDSISVGHPCITYDGMKLIFASDLKENSLGEKSFGEKDLWYITYSKKNKIWDSIPHNMGPEFNTFANELFPSIGPKGELYFASDGHVGIGGLDIFVSQKSGEDNNWVGIKNLGTPINSPGNDFGICAFDSKSGFFSSERKTSLSSEYTSDIWSYSVPPNEFDLRVVVYEAGNKSKKIEGAKVEVVVSDGTKWEGITGDKGKEKGKTEKWIEKKNKSRYVLAEKSFTLRASKEGYYEDMRGAKFNTIGMDQSQSFLIEMTLLPIKEIRPPQVLYPLDQWTFINNPNICNSNDSLQYLFELLDDNRNITIDLNSHTDTRDTELHNQVLSENRSKAVYNFLVDKGIDPRRIKPVGKGESEPATIILENGEEVILSEEYINQFKLSDKAKFEQLHQINRRTTVLITSTEFDADTAPPADPSWRKYKTPLPR